MDLSEWRARIDTVDQILVDLLNRRMSYALEIGKLKSQHGQPVRDPAREQAVLEAIKAHNNGPIGDQALEDIFSRIMAEARSLEAD
tara:strand:- start:347 stop:604 length:258 start_codon:yes stop_codon:yes gene_type:complete